MKKFISILLGVGSLGIIGCTPFWEEKEPKQVNIQEMESFETVYKNIANQTSNWTKIVDKTKEFEFIKENVTLNANIKSEGMQGDANISINSESNSPENLKDIKTNLEATANGNFEMEERGQTMSGSVSLAGLARAIDQNVYLQISDLNIDVPIPETQMITNMVEMTLLDQWIQVDLKEIEGVDLNISQQQNYEFFDEVARITKQYPILKETENNNLEIDKENITSLIQEFYKIDMIQKELQKNISQEQMDEQIQQLNSTITKGLENVNFEGNYEITDPKKATINIQDLSTKDFVITGDLNIDETGFKGNLIANLTSNNQKINLKVDKTKEKTDINFKASIEGQDSIQGNITIKTDINDNGIGTEIKGDLTVYGGNAVPEDVNISINLSSNSNEIESIDFEQPQDYQTLNELLEGFGLNSGMMMPNSNQPATPDQNQNDMNIEMENIEQDMEDVIETN